MTLRDLQLHVDVNDAAVKAAQDAQYAVAASSTAALLNLIGSAYSSDEKPWEWIEAKSLFEAWTGRGPTGPVIDQEYVEAVLAGIKEREASVKFAGQTT